MEITLWTVLAQRGPEGAIIFILIVLLAAFVRAILTGRLVPRSTLEDVQRDRDTWRQAAKTREEASTITALQAQELLSTAQLTNQLLLSLKSHRPGGDST